MSELTLLVLRIGFLLLLWMFIFGIVYALRSDLFGQRVRRLKTDAAAPTSAAAFPAAAAAAPVAAPAPTPAPAPIARASPAADGALATAQNTTRLVITSGPKSGTEFPLSTETITIGRSADSSLVIRDDYTSTHHARLMLWNDEWMLQDLDSTNGTFLAGTRVTVPTKIPLNATVKIGATSFELRR
ncbi:FHA domain-containing protein [Cryobacterium sp. M91]|uniref:FHA domain-containing protein FhaB/FipA n=1 Tax=Cryobacterium sp. M91 TaxID=2048294 RepID=UPI000CE5337B|nr:FHA domain-containing protein [Cryobacterium sp. M91]